MALLRRRNGSSRLGLRAPGDLTHVLGELLGEQRRTNELLERLLEQGRRATGRGDVDRHPPLGPIAGGEPPAPTGWLRPDGRGGQVRARTDGAPRHRPDGG